MESTENLTKSQKNRLRKAKRCSQKPKLPDLPPFRLNTVVAGGCKHSSVTKFMNSIKMYFYSNKFQSCGPGARSYQNTRASSSQVLVARLHLDWRCSLWSTLVKSGQHRHWQQFQWSIASSARQRSFSSKKFTIAWQVETDQPASNAGSSLSNQPRSASCKSRAGATYL